MNNIICSNDKLSFQLSTSYPPFCEQDLHIHDICELFYLIKGSGYYETEGTRYPFKPGMILLMQPGETHRAVRFDEGAYTRIAIHFHPSVIDSIDSSRQLLRTFYNRSMGARNYYDRDTLANTNIYQHLTKMTIPCETEEEQCVQVLSYLPAVLSELAKVYDQNAMSVTDKNTLIIHDILDFINQNLSAPLSVELLCEKFFVTRTQLYRIFKKTTEMNAWEYIVLKRLVLARSMINDGVSTIEAAKLCGFKDYSSFYRAYMAKYGTPPSGIHRTRKK